jgi:hypothetical protein
MEQVEMTEIHERTGGAPFRCDLHAHSRYSIDSGNYALRRARLPESFTDPERVYDLSRRRGMWLVTLTDHNTLEGVLRIAHRPGTFFSVEVTTRFPADDIPLHVLHPLYRMGSPLTPSHVERLLLLFRVWEDRNGARPRKRTSWRAAWPSP